ncbi:hypothetical protein GCM10010517_27480 [Streptosporangium fragile]|uniref:Uncharacterized protein n=1 Tax=Streptosporangium fragile TaxID=46186 RepID=A0ABN3VWF7_9ACTN
MAELDVHPGDGCQILGDLGVQDDPEAEQHALVEALLGGREDEGSIDQLDVLEEVGFAVGALGRQVIEVVGGPSPGRR